MALEDICSFGDNLVHNSPSPASLHVPCEDMTSALDATVQHQPGWRISKRSTRTGNGAPLHFAVPSSPNSALTSSRSLTSVRRPFPLAHGTTTLAFIFQGGVIAAADTRASAGGLVACPGVQKIIPVHSHLVVTTSGSGADCMVWARVLEREIRLYQLRHGRRLSVRGCAKLLSFMLHPFKGTDLCVALTLCGWDKEEGQNRGIWATGSAVPASDASAVAVKQTEMASLNDVSFPASAREQGITTTWPSITDNIGPKLIYVCSDGTRLQGNVFSVGSGSPYAYGVLDGELKWTLSKEQAISLAREAVFRATHRDAYSGNNVDLFYITEKGWSRRERENLKEEYYRQMEKIVKLVEGRARMTN